MILIVGMGMTGITIAEQLAVKYNKQVLMIEKENNIGGIHYDYDERGIVINENGHQIFYSNDDYLWNYINTYSKWNNVENKEVVLLNKQLYPYEISRKQINMLFNEFLTSEKDLENFLNVNMNDKESNCEEVIVNGVGEKLYNLLYKQLIFNKWKINSVYLNKQVGQEFINSIGDKIYKYSALPAEGYSMYFNKILTHPNIKYVLNMSYTDFCKDNDMKLYTDIIYTGKIDDYFTDLNLDYIGYENKKVPYMNFYQSYPIINSISNKDYDRTIEHKYYQPIDEHTKHTFVTFQKYVKNQKPYLPIETDNNKKAVNQKIKENKSIEPHVHFVGRLAEYKNMDSATIIKEAMNFVENNFKKKIVSDIEYSESLHKIYNMNIDNVIKDKVLKAKKLLKDAYDMKSRKLNNSEHLFKIKSHIKFDISTLNDHVIIMSRYNENIDWINQVIEIHSWVNNIIIFNKGKDDIVIKYPEKMKVIPLENVGREGETYLNYIIENYDILPQHVWFFQANPFEHSPDFMSLLSVESVKDYNRLYQGLTYRYLKDLPKDLDKDNRFYINNNRVIEYFISKYDQQVVDIHNFYDEAHEQKVVDMESKYDVNRFNCYYDFLCDYIGIEKPEYSIIGYTWSAMFYVNKEQIIYHKADVYKKLRFKLLEYDVQGGFEGYMLERLWNYIFTRRSYNSLEELYKCYNFKPFSKICGCYLDSHNMLFIMNNENNQNNYMLKTPVYDEGKHMLYIENSNVFVLENSRFISNVLERFSCDNIEKAKSTLIDYELKLNEDDHKSTFIN